MKKENKHNNLDNSWAQQMKQIPANNLLQYAIKFTIQSNRILSQGTSSHHHNLQKTWGPGSENWCWRWSSGILIVRYQCWGNYLPHPKGCDLHHQSSTAQDAVCMCVTQHAAPEDTLHSLLCACYISIFILIYSLKKLKETNYNHLKTKRSGKYMDARRMKYRDYLSC